MARRTCGASGRFAAFRSSLPGEGQRASYALIVRGETAALDDLQWADWSADGRLLAATRDGRLQIREITKRGLALRWEANLAALDPSPSPPPPDAYHW